ncbi:MAG: O-antigen ligase family protein, partial [Solirubrobacteraceae bacterium]
GGWLEMAATVIVLMALSPNRAWQLCTLIVGASGGALLIAAIHQRPAVDHGLLGTAAGRHGGNELIVVALVVSAGTALLVGAIALLEDHMAAKRTLAGRSGGLLSTPLARRIVAITVVCALAAAFVAAGGPHAVAHAWEQFKNPALNVKPGQANSEGRLLAFSGNGRYQVWSSALDAFSSHPLGGIGAGTFQFWWAAHGSIYSYLVNAHSLYFETLAETGVVGMGLLALLLAASIGGAVRRLRRADAQERAPLAAILAATAAFIVAAGVDWVWQIPAIPVALLLLAGAGTASRGVGLHGEERGRLAHAPGHSARSRAAWVMLAALGAVAIAVPLASAVSVRSSQAQARIGQLGSALATARTAAGWQPYAAEPALQQALVLEQGGSFAAAAAEARRATDAAKTDWSAWLVRSRIEAERGDATAAIAAWRKARSLDPRDPLFATG